jgi:phosphoribosylformylglycinamidine cyclo-ligase
VLPADCDAVVERTAWDVPEIFEQIRELGEVSLDEMTKVFNLGIGMVALVSPDAVDDAHRILRDAGHRSVDIGEIVPGARQVRFT